MREHIGGSLTDALKVAKESLSDNNSNVVEFLQHLTANSIFVDKLVANNAFINQLFSHRIKLENLEVNGTTEHGAIYGGERYTADGEINDNSTEETQGFHLSSNGLLQANKAVLKNVEAVGGNFENITANLGTLNEINITGNSIIAGNTLITGIIQNSAMLVGGTLNYDENFNFTKGQIIDDNRAQQEPFKSILTRINDWDGRLYNCLGQVNGVNFYYVRFYGTRGRPVIDLSYIKVYDYYMQPICNIVGSWEYSIRARRVLEDFSIKLATFNSSSSVKFYSLPTTDPHEFGSVYIDNNNNLKLSSGF